MFKAVLIALFFSCSGTGISASFVLYVIGSFDLIDACGLFALCILNVVMVRELKKSLISEGV